MVIKITNLIILSKILVENGYTNGKLSESEEISNKNPLTPNQPEIQEQQENLEPMFQENQESLDQSKEQIETSQSN